MLRGVIKEKLPILGQGFENTKIVGANQRETGPLPKDLQKGPYFGRPRIAHPGRWYTRGKPTKLDFMVSDNHGVTKGGEIGAVDKVSRSVYVNVIIDGQTTRR